MPFTDASTLYVKLGHTRDSPAFRRLTCSGRKAQEVRQLQYKEKDGMIGSSEPGCSQVGHLSQPWGMEGSYLKRAAPEKTLKEQTGCSQAKRRENSPG